MLLTDAMLRCTHTHWLDLNQEDERWILTDPGRLEHLVEELPNPKVQTPSVVLFVGTRFKTDALKAVFQSHNVTAREAHGVANLLLDGSSCRSHNPILYADCTPGAACMSLLGSWTVCHQNHRHTVCGENLTLQNMVAAIHVNLLFPFSHTVCIFADDVGGNQACARYIEDWMEQYLEPIACQTDVKPELLVVTTEICSMDALVQVECHDRFSSTFDSFQILNLTGSSELQFGKFETTFRRVMDNARRLRQRSHLLFTASNLANYFSGAVSQDPTKAIDLFASSHQLLTSLSVQHVAPHLQHFLSLYTPHLSHKDVTDLVASALLVQCYPRTAHCFPPELVFQKFAQPILTCWANTLNDNKLDCFLSTELVLERFCVLFGRLKLTYTAHDLRRRMILKYKSFGARIQTTQTCLWCLMRPPERSLRCGHCLCEECIDEHYSPGNGIYSYVVDRCFVCGLNVAMVLKIKPPTAMPSVFGIDGGGVRGIAALILMKRIQDAVDVPWPLWQFFDSVVGTSIGGVIALDLTVGRYSIDESIARFLQWVTRIFPPRSQNPSWCQKLREFVTWIIHDSIYDSEVLDEVMQEAFGKAQYLFDVQGQHWSGTKLGIMATEVFRAELRIFTNYNGSGYRHRDSGYKTLRPPTIAEEPLVCEVARATVAAPPYFRPKKLKGHRPVQDGGLRANNPCEPAWWELSNIWPGYSQPCLVLSIGTGYHDELTNEPGRYRSFWFYRAIPRIKRSFLSSPDLHGQSGWNRLRNRVDNPDDFVRINLEFEDEEPPLDDVAQIPSLRERASHYPLDARPTVASIWASAFFYELIDRPQLFPGYYVCHGVIYCKFDDARPLLQAIRRTYSRPKLAFDGRNVADFGNEGDYCSGCGLFQQRIKLEVPHLTTTVNLSLAFERTLHRHISSFPNTFQWIINKQSKCGEFRSWHAVTRCSCHRPSRKRRNPWTASGKSKRRRCGINT